MDQEIQKFYLHDRWFYYIKESEDLLVYNTRKSNPNNGIKLEYNKDTKNIKILYFKDGKVFGKLNIIKNSDIYIISYKSLECEVLENGEDTYVNLLYELNMTIKGQVPSDINIKLNKKRKLNDICYLEPTFELDKNISVRNLKIKNNQIEYILNLFSELQYYLPVIYKQIQKNELIMKKNNNEIIKELTIPDELTIYDRLYKLVSKKDYNLVYENIGRDKMKLKMELNPYETKIKYATIECIPKNDKEVKDKIDFSHEINGNIIIKYINFNKIRLELNRVGYTAKLSTYAEYDNNGDTIKNEVYIGLANKEYKLFEHPVFKNKFLDEDGMEYTLGNSDYAKFHGFQGLICPIVHNIEKKLYKDFG